MQASPRDERKEDRLIRQLAADLTPVRRTRSPVAMAALWLAIVAAMTAILAYIFGTSEIAARIAVPDVRLAIAGSVLTAILAAIAACQLGLPDRSQAWALLPLPALALWIGASGAGCLRGLLAPETSVATPDETLKCLMFILAFSLPLSLALALMLRRAYPLRPMLAFGMAGTAAAAAAAALLNFCHPFDASLLDLGAHVLAAGIVIAANQAYGRLASGPEISSRAA